MGCVCGKESIRVGERRFYVRSRLGEGGFSYVDLIEDVQTHKLFALKRITNHSRQDEEIALKEVEIMRMLTHPNVIPLEETETLAIGRYSKTVDLVSEVLIVMPFYRKGSLEDRMQSLAKSSKCMKEEDLWQFFLGICKGLQAMHNLSPPYAHRDVKPANVMIADDETPVLMDLGSATKARVQISNHSEALALQDLAAERCSMLYRAPELFNVENHVSIDERTDIWSLGCVLYAMAFLESPFESAYQHGDSIALAAGGGNIKFPSNFTYSKSVEEMILWLMTVNLLERPFIGQIIEGVETLRDKTENRV
ncbi:serine/threonine-protein kinase 16-like isoform X2 [Liolophura sinensis]